MFVFITNCKMIALVCLRCGIIRQASLAPKRLGGGMAIKRPQSAYFHFCNEHRKDVIAEQPGQPIGEVQKVLSAKWKALTPEDRKRYDDLAAQDKERYQKEVAENPVVIEDKKEEEPSNTCIYPINRVRKVVQSDPDASKVSKDALVAIAKASELFAQYVGNKSYENALFRNKRQIRDSDVSRAIHTTPSLDWLRTDFPDTQRSSEASKPAKTPSTSTPARQASTFFQPRDT